MKLFSVRTALAVALLSSLWSTSAAAQTVAGTISGLVTDASGAAVSGTSIVVTDLDRNVNLRSTSNEAGFYLVTPVPPGRYKVRAEKAGFRSFLVESLPIATQQKATINVSLQIGSLTE